MFNRKKVKKLECEIAALQGALTALTSKIDSLLAEKVDKNDVINQINLSNEQIRISGNKIHITGETAIANKTISSAAIIGLEARKVKAETPSAISRYLEDLKLDTKDSSLKYGRRCTYRAIPMR